MNYGSNKKAWLYLLPAIAFLGLFMIYPLIDVIVYSFEESFNFASQTYTGTGLYNFSYVLRDPYFLQAVKNTFILVIITVPLSTGFALLVSLSLNSVKKLKELYQTVFFLPYVTNTLAVGLVFMILFKKTAYTDGMINLIIQLFAGGQQRDAPVRKFPERLGQRFPDPAVAAGIIIDQHKIAGRGECFGAAEVFFCFQSSVGFAVLTHQRIPLFMNGSDPRRDPLRVFRRHFRKEAVCFQIQFQNPPSFSRHKNNTLPKCATIVKYCIHIRSLKDGITTKRAFARAVADALILFYPSIPSQKTAILPFLLSHPYGFFLIIAYRTEQFNISADKKRKS